MRKPQLIGAAAAIAVTAAAGFGLYAYHSQIAPMAPADRPAFDAATVEKGRILAAAGYCVTCHTEAGGAPFAGNRAIETGFGTIHATNITPDPESGIGAWSPEAFRRAMHEGVRRDGAHLFPAFPFDHFTRMSDEDVDAIYAYVMSEVAPVHQEARANTVPFPLDLRFLQAGWKLLFVDFGRYEADSAKSDEWNRGAYLAEGVAHCGACHTPRNALGAEKHGEAYAGAEIDGWTAPALTASNPSGVPWTASEFTSYLKTGSGTYHGVAAGPMGPVVHAGIAELADEDIAAIGTYFGDIVGAPDSDPEQNPAVLASIAAGRPDPAYRLDLGERLYASACAACHYNAAPGALTAARPDLGINSATRLADPANLIHVMLNGITAAEGTGGVVMPAYRGAFDDAQIAAIAAYLRASRTDLPAWPGLEARVGELRDYSGTH